MRKEHFYKTKVEWTGNRGSGTTDYRSYTRDYTILSEGKEVILGSSDPSFRGDATRYNPEEMLVAALASCHMLWYLHLCSVEGIIITEYIDLAEGIMVETADGGGQFTEVTLKPQITLNAADLKDRADKLHHKANELCFIARSVNFTVKHQANYIIQ
jgi:organic hydroperoxide reductase OsmC/OhrA